MWTGLKCPCCLVLRTNDFDGCERRLTSYRHSGKQSLALEYFNRAEAVSRRSEMPDDLRYYFVTRSIAHFAAGEARQAYRLLDTLTSQADVASTPCARW